MLCIYIYREREICVCVCVYVYIYIYIYMLHYFHRMILRALWRHCRLTCDLRFQMIVVY